MPKQFAEIAEADWKLDKPIVGRELECRDGKIRIFECRDVNLLSYLPEGMLGGRNITGTWGWTDPATGREFVLAGQEEGTAFVESTDPLNPRYLGMLPRHPGSQAGEWHEMKVYKNYAFIVADYVGPHGMQIFDLTQLRDVKTAPVVFKETAHYDKVDGIHNIVIDSATGFAYAVGGSGKGETCGGGLHMLDIRTPTNPIFLGCYSDRKTGRNNSGRIHDAQCVLYHGPDQQHRGRQICLNSAETMLMIADVTDKQKPRTVSLVAYPNVRLTHQGWLTEDHRYFYLGDEWDENDTTFTRTMVYDLKDLDDPVLLKEFFGPTHAADHNMYVLGSYLYQSNYRAGLRILDIKDPPNPREVAYFDSTPLEPNTRGTSGSWNNYPYFRNGVVAVSTFAPNRETTKGLFFLRFRPGAAKR